jgi:lipoic acid synthetase
MRKLDVLQPSTPSTPDRPAVGGCGSPPAAWPQKKPRWLKVKAPGGTNYRRLKGLMNELGLNSVCQEAQCPNIGECWEAGTATFLIMGDKCTRNCPYCAIAHGRPEELDEDEPRRVAEMIEQLQLRHVVITSVDRDDLPDGGARIFGWLIDDIHERLPECSIEVLTPDFRGMRPSIERVIQARPDIFNHNMETVERLHLEMRPGARYDRSLEVLRYAKSLDDGVLIKTGIMLGLGENSDDIRSFLDDAFATGVQIITLGQYLRPSARHRPIDRYVSPDEFAEWKDYGESLGFLHVESGPLVRSSYHAGEQVADLKLKIGAA